MLALPTEAAIEICSGKGELWNSKEPQVILGHHTNILCTFNLSHVSTEITNSLKSMQYPRPLLVNEFFLNKIAKF